MIHYQATHVLKVLSQPGCEQTKRLLRAAAAAAFEEALVEAVELVEVEGAGVETDEDATDTHRASISS